ncbi:MAG: DUF4349 domain-containing protein [Candidatus Paceibacterota bacterium]|jgi:hypothetical protein
MANIKSFWSELSKPKKVLVYMVAVVIILVWLALPLFVGGIMAWNWISSSVFGSSSSALDIGSYSVSSERSFSTKMMAPSAAPMMSGAGYGGGADAAAVSADRSIIRTGSLSLLVEKAEVAVDQIKDITKTKGGFVESANIYDGDIYPVDYKTPVKTKNASVTIRVPEKYFDDTMKAIKDLSIKVNNETIGASDVTDQVFDMNARLKNMKAEESQYQAIMTKATKVEDILNVASRLADVRGRIESLQTQIQNVGKQVAMSSINISLQSEASADLVSNTWRPLSVAKQALQDLLSGLTDLVDALIKFLIVIPIYILWLVIWILGLWVVWKLLKWVKNKLF